MAEKSCAILSGASPAGWSRPVSHAGRHAHVRRHRRLRARPVGAGAHAPHGTQEREGGAPRTLQEIDFLLLVADEARQGALRFAEKEGGPFLRQEGTKRASRR
jgi:hypothetical protein